MVEADGISSRWIIHQDGNQHEYEVGTSYLHIEERGDSLKIYVPRDEHNWDKSFLQALPRHLLAWMMTPPGSEEIPAETFDAAAVNVVTIILSCETWNAISDLLTMNGVPEVEEVEEEPLPGPEVARPLATPTRRRYSSSISPHSPDAPSSVVVTPEPLRSPESGGASYVTPLTDPGDYDFDGYGTVPSIDERLSPGTQGASRGKYKSLLESVVVLAERMARRDYSSADVSAALDSLSLDDDDVFSSNFSRYNIPTGGDRHNMIGAAGELFVSN